MANVKDMSEEELGHFVEAKVLEMLGDPDSGLPLKEEFKNKLKSRLDKPSSLISHEEVIKRFA